MLRWKACRAQQIIVEAGIEAALAVLIVNAEGGVSGGPGVAVDIVAESQRRKAVVVFPGSAESGCPFCAAIEVEAVLACFEAARATSTVKSVGPDSEDYEIHMSIAVDIERIGAGSALIMRHRVAERGKGQAAVFSAVAVVVVVATTTCNLPIT